MAKRAGGSISIVPTSRVSSIGSALADPNRAAMLAVLQSGHIHSAGDLARWCGIAPSTASKHLSKLIDAGLVVIEPAGRHRYYRLASEEVAQLLEAMDSITLPETIHVEPPKPRSDLAFARSCYDHLAGRLGVAVYAALTSQGWLEETDQRPWLTPAGEGHLIDLGVDLDSLRARRRPLVRTCLDWTERQHHLAGAVGAALLDHMVDQHWLRRARDPRVLRLTETGHAALTGQLEVVIPTV